MTPVLQRELRAQSRSRRLWVRRVLMGAFGIGILLLSTFRDPVILAGRGQILFEELNGWCALGLAVICPAITSDLLSREKREGTLGLLVLTPLRAHQLILGKAYAAIVWAVSAWLAVVPVLIVPVLQGGVGIEGILTWLCIQAGVMMLGLSAGLLASANCRRSGMAIVLSYVSLLFGALLLVIFMVVFERALRPNLVWVVFPACLAVAGFFCWWAGLSVRNEWRSETLEQDFDPSPDLAAPQTWAETWDQKIDRRRRVNLLARDPLRWLTGRRSALGVQFAACVLIAWLWLVIAGSGFHPPTVLAWVMALVVAHRSVQVFREARESGMFEMILVSPQSAQIPQAAARSLWWGLGPFVALHCIACGLMRAWKGTGWWEGGWIPLVTGLVVAPALGLWAGWWFRHAWLAMLAVLAIGFLGPLGLAAVMVSLWQGSSGVWLPDQFRDPAIAVVTALLQIVAGGLAYRWVRKELLWRERLMLRPS